MKKILIITFLCLGGLIGGCSPVGPESPSDWTKIEPGDEINGMIITTGTSESPPLWAFCPPALEIDGATSVDCRVPSLPKLAIGHTFGLADPDLQTLDWSALTWELSVDGQPVDLLAFGTYDFVLPDLAPRPSPIREIFRQVKAWDVILTNPTPGAHTLHGMAYIEADTYTWTVNFTIEAPLAR